MPAEVGDLVGFYRRKTPGVGIILEKIEDDKWYYRLKKKHKNKLDQVILNDDIENVVPNFFDREDMKEIINER